MGWFDSGHTEQPPERGQQISIYPVSKMEAVKRFGYPVGKDHPIGKITTDPHGRRD